MIKYMELTAPESSAFRYAKILSIECKEGDQIKEGSTLFRVKSGEQEFDLPSTKEGRVVEMIATEGENITLSTALLLLETEVDGSTATPPIIDLDKDQTRAIKNNASAATSSDTRSKKSASKKKSKRKASKKKTKNKNNEQQTLNLSAEDFQLTQEIAPSAKTDTVSKLMSENPTIEIAVPDIGTDSAKVIEILVKVGDQINTEDPLITLESDKASMDVPSTHAGTVSAINVAVDQDVSEGTVIVELTTQIQNETSKIEETQTTDSKADSKPEPTSQTDNKETPQQAATVATEVVIPDIGGDSAKVIEILVSTGQQVAIEDPLVTLESDKASMDVPSSVTGEIASIEVQLDQDVSEGTVVATVLTAATPAPEPKKSLEPEITNAPDNKPSNAVEAAAEVTSHSPPAVAKKSHASPSIRRLARELGVDISQVNGSGRKGRVTKDDVKGFVKGLLSNTTTSTHSAAEQSQGAGIPSIPAQDFSKFGEIDVQPLNRIKRLTATNLHRSWLNVPHVTHNDEANINDLESFRKQLNAEAVEQSTGIKISPLAFIVKAAVHALRKYPQFNSSLDATGENLILKKYFNIGIAVETPGGLMVPVLREADKKSISEIAAEMGNLAAKARDKKLKIDDMSGACFTISSLGGIGGTSFTPIVNAPEVAILGVSRSKMEPVWNGSEFEPGMMLPLSLSYDHRVIDGAEAARFTRHIAAALEDVRRLTI